MTNCLCKLGWGVDLQRRVGQRGSDHDELRVGAGVARRIMQHQVNDRVWAGFQRYLPSIEKTIHKVEPTWRFSQ